MNQSVVHCPQALILDRYEVREVLRLGGFGAVYRAFDHQIGVTVAVKQMLDGDGDEDLTWRTERFQAEGQLLMSLSHPGIPRVYRQFVHDGAAYLVMQFIDGDPLDMVLDSVAGRLPAERVVAWALQVCEVLEYLHGQSPPIVHRDVKPQNLILRSDGERVTLVDFGLARSLATMGKKSQVGTLGYAPLEQVQGAPEPRSDLYALGATMHHLLTGEKPIPLHVAPPGWVRPGLSAPVIEVVTTATRNDPRRRFATASHMRRALQKALVSRHPGAR